MSRPPTHVLSATGLTRTRIGLSPGHRELLRLLAARAVEDYLAEIDATDEDDREEAAR